MMKKSLKLNVALSFAYQLLKIAVPLVTTPYLARVIGSEGVGVYGYTYSIASYFVLFATMGMSSYGVRQVAACGENIDQRSDVFCNAYLAQLAVGLLILIAYLMYCTLPVAEYQAYSWIWLLFVFSAIIDVSWLLFGVENFLVTTIRSSVVKLLSLVAIFAFVKTSSDLWVYILIISASFLLEQLLVWPFVPKCIHFVKPTFVKMKRHFLANLKLFIPVIAISLYSSLDKVLLGVMSNMNEVGFYEYSYKICTVPLALVTGLGTVMLPRMSDMFSNGQKTAGLQLIEKTFYVMQFGSIGMTFGILGVSHDFVPVFFGENFDACEPCMCVLAISLPFIAGSNVLGRQYLLPNFKDTQYTVSVFVGAITNIFLVLALIPLLGATGAAIGTTLAEFAVLISQACFSHSNLSLISMTRKSSFFAAIGLLMLFLVRAISYVGFVCDLDRCLLLVIEVIAGAFFYIAACYKRLGISSNALNKRID